MLSGPRLNDYLGDALRRCDELSFGLLRTWLSPHEGTGDGRIGQDGGAILQAVCGAVLEELDCDEQAPLGTSVQDLFERGRTQSVHLTLPNDYSSTS